MHSQRYRELKTKRQGLRAELGKTLIRYDELSREIDACYERIRELERQHDARHQHAVLRKRQQKRLAARRKVAQRERSVDEMRALRQQVSRLRMDCDRYVEYLKRAGWFRLNDEFHQARHALLAAVNREWDDTVEGITMKQEWLRIAHLSMAVTEVWALEEPRRIELFYGGEGSPDGPGHGHVVLSGRIPEVSFRREPKPLRH